MDGAAVARANPLLKAILCAQLVAVRGMQHQIRRPSAADKLGELPGEHLESCSRPEHLQELADDLALRGSLR